MPRTPISLEKSTPRLAELDLKAHKLVDRADYERRLAELQETILHVQQAYWHSKRRAVIVFEGWDAAGKGGAIRRLTEKLDPRGAHVWPIAAPSAAEQGRHYLWRFWQKLPEPGTFAIFDRSWYGRVMVERIEGFASEAEWQRAYDEINEFERLLVDDGVRIVKVFLHLSSKEQLARFRERLTNPYKRWKLTVEDLRNRDRRAAYEVAIDEMFERTSTKLAPWTAVPADAKWYARVAVLEAVVDALKRGVDIAPPPVDPTVQAAAAEMLGISL
ncbi:polyphosphate kinase 2 family protein [Oleisolibacter albus]|uniref:polyphosphate kinase 2 family protein n=1 Tax=Oleisolibacter albus TaxID=2171757 RepID=UPI000DF2041E|nr:polyphosphate kinase [Oleisolibacter albus]